VVAFSTWDLKILHQNTYAQDNLVLEVHNRFGKQLLENGHMRMQNAPKKFVSKQEKGESARNEVGRGGRGVEMVANRQVVVLRPT